MDVQLAQPHEHETIADCVDAAYAPFVPAIGKKPEPMTMNYADLIDENRIYVIRGPSGDIRAVMDMWTEADHVLINNLAVWPQLQGQGLGRALIAFAEQTARAQGCAALELYTNAVMTKNYRFYLWLGFAEVERKAHHGYHRIFMRKPLIHDT